MLGDPDYLPWVAAVDLPAYEQLYMSKLVGPHGVAGTVSQLTVKTVKAAAGSRSNAQEDDPWSPRGFSGRVLSTVRNPLSPLRSRLLPVR